MSCSCNEYIDLLLPCKHIFFVRDLKKLIPFEVALVPNRWRKTDLCQKLPLIVNNNPDIFVEDVRNENCISKPINTLDFEKIETSYSSAFRFAQQLTQSAISEAVVKDCREDLS